MTKSKKTGEDTLTKTN